MGIKNNRYVNLCYYKQRSLLHFSTTHCDHLQEGVLWGIYYIDCQIIQFTDIKYSVFNKRFHICISTCLLLITNHRFITYNESSAHGHEPYKINLFTFCIRLFSRAYFTCALYLGIEGCFCSDHTRWHTHTHTQTLTHTHQLSLSLSLTHTHTHTFTLSHTLTFTLSHTHTHTHTHTHAHSHTLTHSLSVLHTHTHTLTHTHTHTHTLTHTHTNTHTHNP